MKPADISVQRIIKGIFWLFLAGSPILVYLVGMLCTDVQFHLIDKKVQNFPVYPGARLSSSDFTDFSYNGHSYHWELIYETEDDMKTVMTFYEGILPQSDWDLSWADERTAVYKSGDLTVQLYQDNSKPGNKTLFGLSIISRYYSTMFDLRYEE